MTYYVPGTQEKDPSKVIMSLQQVHKIAADNAAAIAGYESVWSAWTPTVTAGSGSFTTLGTVTARYKKVGKTVFFYISIPIITNGTAASYVQATLPFATANTSDQSAAGRDNTLSGKGIAARIVNNSSLVHFVFYDSTYPGANGATIAVSGAYESA